MDKWRKPARESVQHPPIGLSLLGLVLVAVVPLLVFGSVAAWMVVQQKTQAIEHHLTDTARALQVTADRELANHMDLLQLMTTEPSLDTGNFTVFQERAARAVAATADWRNVVLIDPLTKAILASATPLPAQQIRSAQPADVDEVVRTRQPHIVGLQMGQIQKKPVVLIRAPVVRADKVLYVLTGVIATDALSDLFAAQQLPASWTGAILDKNLVIVGRSHDAQRFIGKHATPTLSDRVADSSSGMFTALNQEGDTVYTAYSRSPKTGWTVAIGIPAGEVDGPIRTIVLKWGFAGGALVALASLLTAWAGRSIVRTRNAYDAQLHDVQTLLQDALGNYTDLVSHLPIGVYRYRMTADGGHRFDFVSEQLCAQVGSTPEAILKNPELAFDCVVAEDLPGLLRANDAARNNVQPFRWEGRVQLPDGVHWVRMESAPTRLPNGDIVWSGTQQDITERRNAEDNIRKLSIAVEQSPASVVITDLDANIEYVNPRFTEVTGYSAAEAIGQNPRILQSKLTPQSVYVELWDQLTHGQPWRGELVNLRKNGQQYWEEAHIAPIKNAQGVTTHFVAIKTDITQRVLDAERIATLVREQQSILNNELVGIVTVKGHRIFWANPAYAHMLGYEPEEMAGLATRQLYASDAQYQAASAAAYAVLATGSSYRSRIEQMRKDGQSIWLDVSGATINPATGETLWGFIDITQRVRAEDSLKQSESRIRTIFESAADALFIADSDGCIQYVNHAASALLGYSQEELLQMRINDITPDEDLRSVLEEFQRLIATGSLRGEYRLQRKDGAVTPVDFNGTLLPDGTVFGSCRDISERRRMEDQVHQLAFYDGLTALANRRLFKDRLSQAMLASQRNGTYCALLFLDLDNFKPLNDTHGHEAGDLLLVEVAQRMKACVRAVDTVARFGGDEFVVLLSELTPDRITSTTEAARVAEKIREALGQPYVLYLPADDRAMDSDAPPRVARHHCTASIGVVVFGAHDTSAEDALRRADKAMFEAKARGRNLVWFSQP